MTPARTLPPALLRSQSQVHERDLPQVKHGGCWRLTVDRLLSLRDGGQLQQVQPGLRPQAPVSAAALVLGGAAAGVSASGFTAFTS
ncbi:hypothetical protein [Streptomyces sp. NPDC006285]|uniref:hypothetical protein n=1 Tax=Streptomyces sp. NPDC006285 TaxID=3364742 RepID=UPI0036D08E95